MQNFALLSSAALKQTHTQDTYTYIEHIGISSDIVLFLQVYIFYQLTLTNSIYILLLLKCSKFKQFMKQRDTNIKIKIQNLNMVF